MTLQDGEHIDASVDPDSTRENANRLNLLTHDIRSAVFDVIGGLRQVDYTTIDAQTQLQLERIRTSGEILARLVEDALNIVTDGLPGGQAVFANLHLHRLLRDVELRWSGRAQELGLTFTLDVADDLPPVISTDRLGLERVLSNLLSNALKYTEQGGVTMQATLLDGDTLRFAISDSGPGFSDTALSQLFEVHGRPDDTGKPGTGLGLHIAKDIADRMGGTIAVRNIDQGACVTLTLPAKSWHLAATTAGNQPLPDLSDIRVLVAEDNETNQLIVTQMLQVMGAEYEIASDGVDALNWLERERFDIALVDIDMPRLSGLELMRLVRAKNPPLRDLPMLAITAFVLRANRDSIFDAGADRILAKPILSIDAFGQSIAALLHAVGKAPPPLTPPTDLNDLDEVRFRRLLDIAGADGGRELLQRLHTDLSDVSARMSRAIRDLDQVELRGQTHVLISLSGAVGADRLRRLAEALNSAAHQLDEQAVTMLGTEADKCLRQLIDRIASERVALDAR